jgi:prevent-host-death family protein
MGSPSDTVGIRDLKAHLSRHLRRVRAGTHLRVTEHGRTIAMISPAAGTEEQADVEWARRMVADGRAQWSGGKPGGCARKVKLTSGAAVGDAVLADRR